MGDAEIDLSVEEYTCGPRPGPARVRVGYKEIRERDELNHKAFAVYEVRADGSKLERRYSQFLELRNTLAAIDGRLLQAAEEGAGCPFPPKAMYNLGQDIIALRARMLDAWLSMLLARRFGAAGHPFSDTLCSFLETGAGARLSAVGAAVSHGDLVDLNGCVFRKEDFVGHGYVVVYCCASRYNFQQLKAWLVPAVDAVSERYPNLRMVIVSVADLRVVPPGYVDYVVPILRNLNASDVSRGLAKRLARFPGFHASLPFAFFVPDWDGAVLRDLGALDANWTFRCAVAADGVIVGGVQSSTADKAAAFSQAVEAAMDSGGGARRALERHWPLPGAGAVQPPAGADVLASGALSLDGGRGGDACDIRIRLAERHAPALLGLRLRSAGGRALDVTVRGPGPGTGRAPRLLASAVRVGPPAGASAAFRMVAPAAGEYVITVGNVVEGSWRPAAPADEVAFCVYADLCLR